MKDKIIEILKKYEVQSNGNGLIFELEHLLSSQCEPIVTDWEQTFRNFIRTMHLTREWDIYLGQLEEDGLLPKAEPTLTKSAQCETEQSDNQQEVSAEEFTSALKQAFENGRDRTQSELTYTSFDEWIECDDGRLLLEHLLTPTTPIESEQGKEYKDKCSGCGNDDWSSIGLICDNGLHEFSVCRICGMTIFPSEMYVNNSPDQSKSTNK